MLQNYRIWTFYQNKYRFRIKRSSTGVLFLTLLGHFPASDEAYIFSSNQMYESNEAEALCSIREGLK